MMEDYYAHYLQLVRWYLFSSMPKMSRKLPKAVCVNVFTSGWLAISLRALFRHFATFTLQ